MGIPTAVPCTWIAAGGEREAVGGEGETAGHRLPETVHQGTATQIFAEQFSPCTEQARHDLRAESDRIGVGFGRYAVSGCRVLRAYGICG